MKHIQGKNKDGYIQGETIKFVFSDRLSVFDKVVGSVKGRGQILAECTRIIFEYLETKGIKTAYIDGKDDYINMDVCRPLDFEFIMRNLLTGSALKRALENKLILPINMECKEYERFNPPLIEVSTKREAKDRYNLTTDEILTILRKSIPGISLNQELLAVFNEALGLTNRIVLLLTELFDEAGLELVDGKIELGFNKNNELCMIDSFGPDEFRAFDKEWLLGDRKKPPDFYDKQFIRYKLKNVGSDAINDILKENGYILIDKYQRVTERLRKASESLCHQ